jgi:hypothetical protein
LKEIISNTPRVDEDYQVFSSLVHTVIAAYVETLHIMPTAPKYKTADSSLMELAGSMGSISSHFRMDVERVTASLLKHSPTLQAAWFDLADEKSVPTEIERALVERLGRAYIPLDPFLYFRSAGSVIPSRGINTQVVAA